MTLLGFEHTNQASSETSSTRSGPIGSFFRTKQSNNGKIPMKTITKPNRSTIIRVESWNLRNDSMPDSDDINKSISKLRREIPFEKGIKWYSQSEEKPWSKRRIGVANEVIFNRADLFTVNEALARQVEDLDALLPQMRYIGIGRDDGRAAGEFEAIYYDSRRFEVLEQDTFWMSNTPWVPTKYPGAGSIRSATVGHFREIATGVDFCLINIHLDEQSDAQRRLGAAMLKLRGGYEYAKNHCPVLLVGDFNSQSSGGNSGAYQILTGAENYDVNEMPREFREAYRNPFADTFVFDDLMKCCRPERRTGNLATFTNFKPAGKDYTRIDFQFGGNPNSERLDKKWDVEIFRIGENWFDWSYYLSDHRPVVCDLAIRT